MRALIIITVSIGIAAVVATIMVGSGTFEGTVEKDPYEAGLQWDAVRKMREESGWNRTVITREVLQGRSDLEVRLLDRDGRPLQGVSVVFAFSRPETSRYDRTYPAAARGDGLFSAPVDLPKAGEWQLRTMITQGVKTVMFEDYIRVVDGR
jgi:nitrogen fixation protein FixH